MKNNNYTCHGPDIRNSIAYGHGFWCTCVIWWYLQALFSCFSKFWFSWLLGQKMAQNYKKFCRLLFISQEPYIIWLSFMIHLCKMMISSGVFFPFFQNFDFPGCWRMGGRGGGVNSPKSQNHNIKILTFFIFIGPIVQFFFNKSLIISKQKFWGVTIFFTCVRFKDTQKAFDNFKNKQRNVWSNAFWYVKVCIFWKYIQYNVKKTSFRQNKR